MPHIINRPLKNPAHPINKAIGYALLEAMLGIFIFAVGILKFVQLDIKTSQAAQDNLLRAKANLLAADMIDRMRGNYQLAQAGSYSASFTNITTTSNNCRTQNCNITALKDWDIAAWQNTIAAQLPNGKGAISSTLQADIRIYSVSIRFENRQGQNDSVILVSGL